MASMIISPAVINFPGT